MDDHYEALGLEETATTEEVKRAFKQLALKYHPDQHPSPIANAIFRTLNEAYLVLSDPERRRAYDEELRIQRAQPRRRGASRARAPSPPPSPPPAQAPRQETGRDDPDAAAARRRREGVRRCESARQRARKASDLSHRAVRENEERMRDLFAQAEAEVAAEEGDGRSKKDR